MKKSIVNGLLVLCTLGLGVACFYSIYDDIAFDEEKAAREKLVIARLMDIRNAEEQYKLTFGEYCGTIDSIIDFVKNGKTVDKIIKEVDFDVFITGPDQCHDGFKRAIEWCEANGKEHIVLGRTDGVSSSELKAKIAEKTSKR